MDCVEVLVVQDEALGLVLALLLQELDLLLALCADLLTVFFKLLLEGLELL